MKKLIKFILLSTLLVAASVDAATITYQKRDINAGVNKGDYKASWAKQTSAISSLALQNFNSQLGGNNRRFRIISAIF